ncbi:PREDICTED: F-box protein FBW2-like [Tarenaya hassleriana]|uniref:F-box protein FBW2-like n=1 Tax=Tarenaya hassleriana TaxID=28532 RepID=UPI00053C4013|nr:PREDICTED: F-box protein FBW2-like [Tarenaya hassleriana]XP_010543896.1 PREDICTED: F-box protein FBW2-like [Tarenaya hassleriana]XP_010543904.1 PREDICTED: F-box protein FBW2-like [Tarenaya hassleriana]XP_019058515.1 PREDICTED: F-box protein FBW2-like [Tarenaya hassleriana]
MEEESEFRHWDELIPDALGLIFRNLPLQEVLTVVPRVCKAWNRAVNGPYCWQEIDIELWSNRRHEPHHLDRMLQTLITRSSGSLRKLAVTGLQNDSIFSFIAQHAGSLRMLRVPRSDLSDSVVEEVAEKLSTLTFLDLSYCCKLGSPAIEAIGKHCKSLVEFCRNMHPLDVASVSSHDDEAYAIANSMPKLKRLEMAYLRVSTEGVLKILSSCPSLEFLELRGCWDVQLDSKFFKEKFPNLKVLGPRVVGFYEMMNDWEDCSDYFSDGSEYLAWEFLDGEMGEFYEDEIDFGFEGAFYAERLNSDFEPYLWPPSP